MVLLYDYKSKIHPSEEQLLNLFASDILISRQLGSIKMLPYSILDEEEQWKVSHRVLPVWFTVAYFPFIRENFTPLFFY